MALEYDAESRKDYDGAAALKFQKYQEYRLHLVKIERTRIMSMGKEHRELLFAFDKLPHRDYIQAKAPINKIKLKQNGNFGMPALVTNLMMQ